jgi:hypothetical protein
VSSALALPERSLVKKRATDTLRTNRFIRSPAMPLATRLLRARNVYYYFGFLVAPRGFFVVRVYLAAFV